MTSLAAMNTRNRKCLERVRTWMAECLQHHKLCTMSPNRGQDYIPARLLVVDKRYQLRLVERQKSWTLRDCRYATLTHRWGEHRDLMLSRSNKNSLKNKIAFLSLPSVFRDAIRVCQYLAIPYLWIDTLCIVQDDDADRVHEIANMGHVYENACLNIGAVAAGQKRSANHEHGLFVERIDYAKRNDPVCVQIRRTDYDQLGYVLGSWSEPGLNDTILMSRGWVLQERLLSQRSIYFDEELRWECSELLATEYFPDGLPRDEYATPSKRFNTWGRDTPFRIKNLILNTRHMEQFRLSRGYDTGGWMSKYESWLFVVERFSKCELTYASDRLLALSGLAKHFAKEFKDSYLAGMWKEDLFDELLWHRRGGIDYAESEYIGR